MSSYIRDLHGPLLTVTSDGVVRCGVCAVPIVGPSPTTGVTSLVGWRVHRTPDGRVRVVLVVGGTVLHECGHDLADALAEQVSAFLAEPVTLDSTAPAHERADS